MNKYVFIVLAILLIQHKVLCQGLFDSVTSAGNDFDPASIIEWNGYTRGTVYGAGENYDYATAFGEFAFQSTLMYKSAFLFSDVRFRGGVQYENDTVVLQIKEIYASYQGSKIDVYFGNQIVQWGRTDGFNPTNNITPNDYFFLTPEPDDQKLSNTLLRLKYRINPQIELDLIGIPVFKPSIYRYDLFTITEGAHFVDAEMPGHRFDNGSLAGRLNFEYAKAGFSFSYFNGYDPFYGFRIDEIDLTQSFPVIQFIPDFYRKQTVGIDYSHFMGSWISRGEIAYNHTKDYKSNMHIPYPEIAYVFGLEGNFMGITAILQYVGKYVTEFTELQPAMLLDPSDPEQLIQYMQDRIVYESSVFNRKVFNQQEEFNHALFLAINRSFLHEILQLELSGYYNITSEEYLIRPTLSWKINDYLQTKAGGSYMKGPENSIFDLSKSVLNGAFIELKVSF